MEKMVKQNKVMYSVKQTGRQWMCHLSKALVEDTDKEHFKADPCVCLDRFLPYAEMICSMEPQKT